ncbi:MAG: DUF6321 domain-containing protein [Steroidobacteraceae bacterium]
MAKRKKSAKRSVPWKRAAPKGSKHRSLTPAKKAAAKRRAKKAGRPYPNLVDNMRAARGKKTARKAKRKSKAKKKTKDPHGGLTAEGRREFARKQGAHLKPGVKRKGDDMTPQDMRRKGSWATRFYGRKGALPPLKDAKGEPTRFALTAAAWGEPVPKTVAAARRIAAKGKRLLERYRALKG